MSTEASHNAGVRAMHDFEPAHGFIVPYHVTLLPHVLRKLWFMTAVLKNKFTSQYI